MKNKFILMGFLGLLAGGMQAQNPIISGQFTADPTARVFDGKIYLYPSHDIPSPVERLKEWFCMADYHVFSSDNLVDWTDHGVILSQEKVPWVASDSYSMWAPDCICKNGKYYFYFPSTPKGEGRKGFNIGVAVADNPSGPFVPQAEPIKGVHGIDPCVLLDKDGQAYLYWSGRGLMVAKLKDNMLELASEPISIPNLPEGFKEGPFAFERAGKYYLTFPWVKDKTETLAYAMGNSPMGPFEYKGLIMEQSPVGCWTNHHSLVEYKNQWYLFYHHNDYSPEFDKNRSTRIDSLFFNSDGTIRQVTPTLRGVGITDARKEIQIDRYSQVSSSGTTLDFLDKSQKFKGWKIVLNQPGAWLQYNNVDFGQQKTLSKVCIQACTSSITVLQIRTKGKTGDIIAEVELPDTGAAWKNLTFPIKKSPEGIQDLWITLQDGKNIQLDWICFK